MTDALAWESTGPEETLRLGAALGRVLRGGDLIALSGPLGAGKTHLVKGIAAGLGVAADEPVVSPTFVLAREYVGRLRLYHLDAYRLSGADELVDLGFEEMLADPVGVVAVEWADRVPEALPPPAWRIELVHVDETTRRLRVLAVEADRQDDVAAALAAESAESVVDRLPGPPKTMG